METKHDKLEVIKQFKKYIDNIILKGYMNDIETLDKLEQFITDYDYMEPQFIDEDNDIFHGDTFHGDIFHDNTFHDNTSHDDTSHDDTSSSESDNDTEDSSNEKEASNINKLYAKKIDHFLNKSNDLSNIHLYNKSIHYIDTMEHFISTVDYQY